jgi:hypothetical protein
MSHSRSCNIPSISLNIHPGADSLSAFLGDSARGKTHYSKPQNVISDIKRLSPFESHTRHTQVNPKDIRIDRYYLPAGKGSLVQAVHLPTGVSVAENVAADSTETGRMIHARLLSALKLKIQKGATSESRNHRVPNLGKS